MGKEIPLAVYIDKRFPDTDNPCEMSPLCPSPCLLQNSISHDSKTTGVLYAVIFANNNNKDLLAVSLHLPPNLIYNKFKI